MARIMKITGLFEHWRARHETSPFVNAEQQITNHKQFSAGSLSLKF
jgi:hypothetical protein